MSGPSDAQLEAILQQLDPAALRQSAEFLPPALRDPLMELADAAEAPDPKVALRAYSKRHGQGGMASVQRWVQSMLGAATTGVEFAQDEVKATRAQAEEAEQAAERLAQDIEAAMQDWPDAEAVTDRIREVAQGVAGPSRGVLGETEAALEALKGVIQGARAGGIGVDDLQEFHASLRQIEAQSEQARQAAEPARLVPFLDAMREVAERMDRDEEALRLSLLAAAFRQADQPSALLDEWQVLLARAEALEAPLLARQAARLPQAHAMAHQDFQRLATLAERTARIAEQADHGLAAVTSRCEQALALAQAHAFDEARHAADLAVTLAVDLDDTARLRAGLTRAQVLEMEGSPEAAPAYLDVLRVVGDDPGHVGTAGRASLGVGRAWTGDPASPARLHALETAVQIGQEQQDASLFVPAVAALARARGEAGDLQGAVKALLAGRGLARRLAPEASVDTHLMPEADRLRERFGAEAFQAALDATIGANHP